MTEAAAPPSATNTNDMTDLAIVAKVGKRSNDNITDIKNNLKTLEGTLIKLSTSRDSLIDAIVRDAAESINYWQEVVKKRKSELKIVLQSFISCLSSFSSIEELISGPFLFFVSTKCFSIIQAPNAIAPREDIFDSV